MSSKYKKGVNFEYRVKQKLEEHGYFVVRSAGSHGVFDLIAFPQVWHLVCPYCGSINIEEIKPNWGICHECEDNFYMIPKSLTDGKIAGIQCKAQKGLSREEKARMINLGKKYGIFPYLATKFNGKPILIDLLTDEVIQL